MTVSLRCLVDRALDAAEKTATERFAASMLDAVKVERTNGVGPMNYGTGLLTDTLSAVYTGDAEVGEVSGGDPVVLGEEMVFYDQVQVTLPATAARVKIDDLVTVTAARNTLIKDRVFRVTSVATVALAPAVQSLACTAVSPSRQSL